MTTVVVEGAPPPASYFLLDVFMGPGLRRGDSFIAPASPK